MEKIAIITDSCADVPEDLAKRYHIHILPMVIICEDGEYKDGVNIHAEDIYERLKTELPKTSTPTGEDMENLLERLEREGYTHAVAILLSGGLSGTVNHMRLAAEDCNLTVSVIDSKQGSIGIGAVAVQAAMWLENGCSYTVLVERVSQLCQDTTVFFSIDTLEYLEKGGRIGKMTALVGSALNIKPIISFDEEGELYTPAKVRGRKLVEKKILSLLDEVFAKAENQRRPYNLMVADGGAAEEREELELKIKQMYPQCNYFFRAKIGGTLSAYVGPGLLGAGVQFLPEE